MTKSSLKLLMPLAVTCFASTADCHEKQGTLLIPAIRCLAQKGFISETGKTNLGFSYITDRQSYIGKTVLYVIKYSNQENRGGSIFTLFVSDSRGKEIFNIQNNAQFKTKGTKKYGVHFVTPPLGGTWTEEHLTSAIMQARKGPKFIVDTRILHTVSPSVRCKAYSDK